MDSDAWHGVLDVHLNGTFYVTQAAWPHLQAQRYGRVIATASGAIFGNAGHANYGAAKMGIVGLAKMLAVEGAPHGITANVIAPTAVTRMSQSKGQRTRGADLAGDLFQSFHPELAAPLIAWLAHPDCTTTGEIFSVGGGRIARIFLAEAHGWIDRDLTAEKIQAAWTDICAPDRPYNLPHSMGEYVSQLLSSFDGTLGAPRS
jgi:NAD(P)-dependent dehydrogenase (short-subunit alcohol dehydrogenase family)